MKRIGVIGSINRDLVVHPDGSRTASLGGVLYTVLALAYLGHPEVEVWPLLRVGRDAVDQTFRLLAGVPGVRLDGVEQVNRPASRCELQYRQDGSKVERLTGGTGALDPRWLGPQLTGLDALLVNYITGYELRLEDLPRLRRQLAGPLLMDVHSLTLGRHRNGERYWRRPSRWRDWVGSAEVVQLNEAEASLLAGPRPDGTDGPADLDALGAALLQCGPRVAVITRGPLGAVAFERVGKTTRSCSSPAESPERAVDPTGCGDVFLAALALGWLRQEPLPAVVARACHVAGVNSRIVGLAGMASLAACRRH